MQGVSGAKPAMHHCLVVAVDAVVVAKLTYAASSWWGFTTAEDRQRLAAASVLDFAILITRL